ncbi:MAG: chemotaxis protein CheX [Magnetococcus sp. XQGC-1]
MIVRQHERVALDSLSTLYLKGRPAIDCQTLDVSLGGIKVVSRSGQSLVPYVGSDCIIEFPVTMPDSGPDEIFFIKAKARIVNGNQTGVGMQFQGVDAETLQLLKKIVENTLQQEDLTSLRGKKGVSMQEGHVKTLKILLEEHILLAVKEIFIAFLAMDVTPGPYVEHPAFIDYVPPVADVTGIIRFEGEVTGGVHLVAPLHFAINAAAALLGEAELDFKKQQEDMVWDAFGEITNQVAGSIQTRLSDQFSDIQITAPQVCIGSNPGVGYPPSLNSVRHFFGSAFGPFYVECFFA